MITAPTMKSTRTLATQVRHHPLATLRDEFDDVLSRFLGGQNGWLAGRMFLFADVSETDTTMEVTLDIPGVDSKEIDIHLAGNVLTIRGERKERKEDHGRQIHRAERRTGTFSRSITLPCPVVDDQVVADYQNGVLAITLPKCEEARSRKIAVTAVNKVEHLLQNVGPKLRPIPARRCTNFPGDF